jgi:T5SS/PEP-CTERM-associated repeat protein
MKRALFAAAGTVALGILTSQSPAAVISWLGGPGALTDANYTDGTTSPLSPLPGDIVQIGAGGVLTQSSGALSYGKLRVGHNDTTAGPLTGQGNLTINNGTTVSLTAGAAGIANAALWVGNVQNGTLTIDGPGSSLTSNRLVAIGIGNNTARTGTLNITNGGALVISQGNLALGDRAGSTGNGVQGHVFLSGANSSITFSDPAADLNIGARGATSSFNMSGGTVSGLDVVDVGVSGTGSSTGSSFNLSGGTFSHGGSFFVGRSDSINSVANLSGGTLNTGNRFLLGAGNATGNTVNHTDGTLNTTSDVRVGDANTLATATNTYNFSGPEATSLINATTGMIVGRQANGTFVQTGGTATLGAALQIGNRETATLATTGLYTISDGTLVVNSLADALSIAPKGTGQFRVVGDDAVIDLNGNFLSSSTPDGTGTLAFELEAGDSLSLIDVSGTATFAAGSILSFDTTNALPTQTTYDLLTATDITDNGLVFTAPANWTYQIVPGGNGELLQATLIPEPTTLTLLALAPLTTLRRRRHA